MPVSTVDERRVYYACRPIFSGGQAGVRKPDRVLDVLKNHAHFLRPLVKTMKLEQVADICRSLLALKVFESVAMAKIVRPELFAQPISTGAMDKIENNMAVPASPKSTALVVPSPTKDYRRESVTLEDEHLLIRQQGPSHPNALRGLTQAVPSLCTRVLSRILHSMPSSPPCNNPWSIVVSLGPRVTGLYCWRRMDGIARRQSS